MLFLSHTKTVKKKSLEYIFLLLPALLFYHFSGFSQNMLQNPSFEEPLDFKSENKSGWHKLQSSDTPDYFNFSLENPINNIFDDYLGGTNPKSGNAFVGIFCIRVNPQRNIKDIREFIESPLIEQLEKDSIYKIELSLSLDGESNIAIKNFGILFSEYLMQSSKDLKLLALKPQIEFNSSFLDNSENWITLQAFYKASGNEKFITLGNFRSDRTTTKKRRATVKQKGKRQKWGLSNNEKAAYYYIDDVTVEKVSIQNELELPEALTMQIPQDTFDIEKISIDSAIVLRNVYFDFNKHDLLSESYKELDKLLYLLITNPAIKIRIEGHTDNIGSYQFNLSLSLRRVESVANYLILRGINPHRIELAGFSFNAPIASNETEDGRKLNRRVAFKITEK